MQAQQIVVLHGKVTALEKASSEAAKKAKADYASLASQAKRQQQETQTAAKAQASLVKKRVTQQVQQLQQMVMAMLSQQSQAALQPQVGLTATVVRCTVLLRKQVRTLYLLLVRGRAGAASRRRIYSSRPAAHRPACRHASSTSP